LEISAFICYHSLQRESSNNVTGTLAPARLSTEDSKQVTHFTVYFVRAVHGVGNFLAKKFAKTMSHPGNFFAHRSIGHLDQAGDFGIPRLGVGFEQTGLQMMEHCGATTPGIIRFQASQHQIEQGHGPFSLVNALGCEFIDWLPAQIALRVRFLQRNGLLASSTLSRPDVFSLVREEVFETAQQERAELRAFTPSHFGREVILQEMDEEALSEIFRVARLKAKPQGERQDRRTVLLAQPGKCCARVLALLFTGSKNNAPICGGKRSVGAGLRARTILVGRHGSLIPCFAPFEQRMVFLKGWVLFSG
jgi:hypothetical protein